jgi:integrase
MKVTRGNVLKRTWTYEGRERTAWGYTFRVDKAQHRRQGFGSRAEAQDALDAAREAILHPAPVMVESVPVAPGMTFGEACDRYLKAKARKRSLAEDTRIVKHLKAELGEQTPLADITAARISAYKGRRLAVTKSKRGEPLSAASINRPLALLRCLLTMAAREWEVLATVPTIRLEQEPEGKVVWIEADAEQALLDAARASRNPDLYALVLLAVETGMRCGEVLGLEWARIDLSRGIITLASRSTKSKRRRDIPMRQAVYDLLAAREDRTGHVFARREWDSYRTAFETIAAKVVTAPEGEPLTFHGLRHHFASWFMMRGGRREALSKILGHATMAMTDRYAHLSPDYLRSEMAKTEGRRAQGEQNVSDVLPTERVTA